MSDNVDAPKMTWRDKPADYPSTIGGVPCEVEDNDYSFDVHSEWSTDDDGTLHHATETGAAPERISRDLEAGLSNERVGRRELLNRQLQIAVHCQQSQHPSTERPLSHDIAKKAELQSHEVIADQPFPRDELAETWPRKTVAFDPADHFSSGPVLAVADLERELLGRNPLDKDILDIALEGRKISAIKVYRDRYSVDLRDAQTAVDEGLQRYNDEQENGTEKFQAADPEQDPEPQPIQYAPPAPWVNEAREEVRETEVPLIDYTLYPSGPMRGVEDYNYPLFNRVTKRLREQGYRVKNPAENFYPDPPGTHTYSEYMALDIQSVIQSDGIVLLPGWQKSEGAKFEIEVGRLLGRDFYEWSEPATGKWKITKIEPPSSESDGIEAAARKLVYGDRNEAYGPPSHDFECTGRKWAATLSAHTGTHIPDIPPEIVAVMMADLKTSRLGTNPTHLDSRIDVIGYILCLDRIITGK